MSEIERGYILQGLHLMDEKAKNFVMGYMAGKLDSELRQQEKQDERPQDKETVKA